MPRSFSVVCVFLAACPFVAGCATQRESHTSRTGVEQLLISSAVDQALDKVDLTPLAHRQVFLDPKYLDCSDKNYILMSLQHRLLTAGAKLTEKPETADVVLQVGSGGVGTDGSELFVGIPEIPLPPPSPIAIPKLALFTRTRLNGTAKLLVIAYDARTKAPLIQSGTLMARSDQNNWNVLGAGPVQTGTLPDELLAHTGQVDLNVLNAAKLARQSLISPKPEQPVPAAGQQIQPAGFTP